MTERFTAAIIGAPFGLKGFVKARSLSGENGHLLALRRAALCLDGVEAVYEVAETAQTGAQALIRFQGIDSPEAAKRLRGAELLVSRDEAAALRSGEYYVADLRGLDVVAACVVDGFEVIGTVTDVLEGGGGDLLEMRLLSGELKLVPLRDEFFGDMSPAEGRVVLLQRWILE
jgi:16S rRNA processing protein RimM